MKEEQRRVEYTKSLKTEREKREGKKKYVFVFAALQYAANNSWLRIQIVDVSVVKSAVRPVGTFPDNQIASLMGTFSRHRQLHDGSCGSRFCFALVIFFSLEVISKNINW
jgi:hypothetical protein